MNTQITKESAYIKMHPIQSPEHMRGTIPTKPFDKDWEERISDCWWYHKNNKAFGVNSDMFVLRNKLLSFGGFECCMPVFEPDLQNILQYGQLWYGDRIDIIHGEHNQCHSNSAKHWHRHKDKTVLCTGYALSEDGMWRQHSWLVRLKPMKNRIIETTVPRVAYFGFAMTEKQAQKFYEEIY